MFYQSPGHKWQHGDPHHGGLEQHEDVWHGCWVRSNYQHHKQLGNLCNLSMHNMVNYVRSQMHQQTPTIIYSFII